MVHLVDLVYFAHLVDLVLTKQTRQTELTRARQDLPEFDLCDFGTGVRVPGASLGYALLARLSIQHRR